MPERYLGQQLGEYFPEERIGRGAMAIVYRAYQRSMERYVALKVIKLDLGLGEDDEFRARFAQEAEVIASLEHIHILPVYDYGLVDGEIAYIAMRLLRGGSLSDQLANGPLPLDRAADIVTQIARGLSYAHRHGVIHRDLKPSNILFDNHGNAYLSDFGLAKVLSRADMTRPGHLVGTPAYVAPEALQGDVVDHRADIYSLGVLTYEILAGRPPFEADEGNLLSLIRMHLEEEPPDMRDINSAIPPEVEAVVMRALRKDPRQRFADAEDLANALNAALGRHYSTGSQPAIERPVIQPSRRPLPGKPTVALLVAVTALLITLGLWTVLRPRQEALTAAPLVPTILAGERGSASDVVPSPLEISRAQARLGQDGFIAFIACTMDSAAQTTRAREFGDIADEYGLGYRSYDSANDMYTQITRIEQARLEGAGALILCPLDRETLKPVLDELKQDGVPLAFVTLFDAGYGVVLDSNNYEVGLAAGQYAGQLIQTRYGGQANVVLLGYPGFPASERRADGMAAGLREEAPDATILGVYQGFTREDGHASIQRLLEEGADIDVIVSMNDAGSFGAIDALTAANVAPDTVDIVSVNAEPLALEYIREGTFLRGSVPLEMSEGTRAIFDATVRLLAGGTVPERLIFPSGPIVTRETLDAEPEQTAAVDGS